MLNSNKHSFERGFTLIEFIIVIIILAILSVAAVIKYIDIKTNAVDSKLDAVVAAFKHGVQQAQMGWQVAGRPQNISNQVGPTVEMQGRAVTVDQASGLPVGDAGRDRANNVNQNDCVTIFQDIVTEELTVIRRRGNNNPTGLARSEFDFLSTRTNSNPDVCNYYYTASFSVDENNPNNNAPSRGRGFTYNAGTGSVTEFIF